MMKDVTFQPIGIIHTPYKTQAGTPIQPYAGKGITGTVEIYPEFRAGLMNLQRWEYIWLLYVFHRSDLFKLRVIPYRDTKEWGVFATRVPSRPNGIGLSAVKLTDVDEGAGRLEIADIDILDESPLLDIKPYVTQFDLYPDADGGWREVAKPNKTIADDRFSDHSSS